MMGLTMALVQAGTSCARCELSDWKDWHVFQRELIDSQGRVIDYSDDREITTSEGQSYAMFFALVDNDPVLFRRLLRWTERNLAKGDLTAHLPAWLWGRDEEGNWGVLDGNSASDANLWIAYSLLEAGRLWKEHSYSALGNLMLQRIAKEETESLPPFGTLLIPGKAGFLSESGGRLNPSYLAPQLLARAHAALPGSVWGRVLESSVGFLVQSAPLGLAPDWVDLHRGEIEPSTAGRVGSYNAIRVYLWIGMLHDAALSAARLKAHFGQASAYLEVDGGVAERVDILDGSASEAGPLGFSAAMLPLFRHTEFGQRLRESLASFTEMPTGYYNRVLYLFGTGWDEKRFAFDENGYLLPAWRRCR
ncbi:MAG TPA: cellulose synthase complex periplasmic endoglucanase BcsZ [Pusillimonas sp.]|uniref:cellulose synthase complex periplasmic endoglucanase BcsZ n=1 Tax=unclassified Pusillimonas TaxID=2640016 RepID=UPI00262C71EE|nr:MULTISPECIES: cellulose synthase complex periplasmic endoglucanase BcsZ [unclassified Pusillimonas]HLU20324.1 cellulose synthase complex periplasmic endoglucanase BcsZ [Pusillimonas sp.]